MPRVGTSKYNFGQWLQGENPGAGPQGTDSNGLNGNWLKIEALLTPYIKADTTLEPSCITGAALHSNVADGTTIQKNGSNQLEVMDGGIGTAKYANGSITSAKLAAAAVGSSDKLADSVVITSKIADLNVTTAKLALDAVGAAQMSHDNNRTKAVFSAAWPSTYTGATYPQFHGQALTAAVGIPMPRAGSLTCVAVTRSGGSVHRQTYSYNTHTFAAGDDLGMYCSGVVGTETLYLVKNGGAWLNYNIGTDPEGILRAIVIEVEFDD